MEVLPASDERSELNAPFQLYTHTSLHASGFVSFHSESDVGQTAPKMALYMLPPQQLSHNLFNVLLEWSC